VGSVLLLAAAIDAMDPASAETRAEAFGLWLAAAAAGEVVAMSHVGQCYRDGVGVDADLEAAAAWYRRAAAQGDEAAFAALTSLEQAAPVHGPVAERAPVDAVAPAG
jgi:TPR repeat protein